MDSTLETAVSGTPTKKFAIGEATKVDLSGPGTVSISRAATGVLTIAAGAADFEHLEIKAGGDSVKVEFHGGLLRNREPAGPLRYELAIARLEELKLEGELSGEGTGIDGDSLKIELKSGSSLSLSDLRSSELEAKVSDGGRLTISGAVTRQKIRLTGGSIYQGAGAVSEDTEVEADDGSEASVRVSKRLKVKASDASSVSYAGENVDLNVQTSNGAKFKQLNN